MFLKFVLLLLLIEIKHGLTSEECGVPASGLSLIIKGQNFRRGAWPWMVALLSKSDDGNKFFCGGVLISRNKVLTAAHCIQEKYQRPRLTRNILLMIGAYNLNDRHEEGVFLTTPSNVIMHPDWNPSSTRYDADIAAILLEEEVTISKFIKPICLGSMNIEINEGFVTGWGKSENSTTNHESIPKELKIPIWTNDFCWLEAPEFTHLASKRTLCAGGRDNSGPCNGDSGGGLFIKGPNGAYYLKGIVSAALAKQGNCDVSNFALYTNVDKFIEWIDIPTAQLSPMMMESSMISDTCGIMSSSAGLVQNGKVATSVQWPWVVVIFNKAYKAVIQNQTYSDFEVGSLITSRHVIADGLYFTTGNSTNRSPLSTNLLKLYFGVTDIDDYANSHSLVLDGADDISFRPELGNFNSVKFANFVIIKLKTSVIFSQFISPVCLSSFTGDPYILTGRYAYGVGMGYSETGKTKDGRYTPMRIRSKETCEVDYEYSLGTTKNRSLYFCAGGDGGSNACWSDHPLYLKQDGKWFLHAFIQVAYNDGQGCRSNLPVLYELAGPYYNWIQNKIGAF